MSGNIYLGSTKVCPVVVKGDMNNLIGFIFSNYGSPSDLANIYITVGDLSIYDSSVDISPRQTGVLTVSTGILGGTKIESYYWILEKNADYSLFYKDHAGIYHKIDNTLNFNTDTFMSGSYLLSGGSD